MSLVIGHHIPALSRKSADDLPVGVWFTDETSQVYVTAIDDRNGTKRVICLGGDQLPFISDASPEQFTNVAILPLGTSLSIVDPQAEEMETEDLPEEELPEGAGVGEAA